MSRSSYRRLLDRGRRAGLNADELYRALSARRPSVDGQPIGQTDPNGYVARMQANGQRIFQHASKHEPEA
jgi:hypothetical protein